VSGKEFIGFFDPLSGKPKDEAGTVFDHSKFDEKTGRPVGKDGKVIPLDKEGYPVIDGKKFPQRFDSVLGVKVSPDGEKKSVGRYDPNTGLPVDQITEQSTIVHPDTMIPTNMRTSHAYPEHGTHVPGTGQFISREGNPVHDRFDAETGRPIDQ
jgi:hypothetical protein